MFSYLRMRRDFLEDCKRILDAGDDKIINSMAAYLNHSMRNRVTRNGNPYVISGSDKDSWKESMGKFRPIMESLGNDTGISFEYMLDYRDNGVGLDNYNKRTDVMIAGIGKDDGKMKIVVAEIKRWSTAENEYDNSGAQIKGLRITDGKLKYYSGHEEDNPAKDVKKYCDLLKKSNTKIKSKEITLIPIVWMYNYDKTNSSIINELEKVSGVKIFYQNQENEIKDFYEDLFGNTNQFVFSELRKGFPVVKLHDEVRDIIQGGKNVNLRVDQQYCYESICKMIDDDAKEIVYVQGRAGSGKSIVGIMLLKYCIEKGKKAKYISPEGAPINAYQNAFDEKKKKDKEVLGMFMVAREGTDYFNDNPDVLLIDEGHSMYQEHFDNKIKKQGKNKALIIVFCDAKQGVNEYKESNELLKISKPHFILDSQFRCNYEEGYLSFIDDILEGTNSGLTADLLDFDVRLIENDNKLEEYAKKKEFIIVTGPQISDEIKNKGFMKAFPFDTYNNSISDNIFIKKHIDKGISLYSGYNSVRGLEADNFIVIVGKKDIKLERGKVKVSDEKTKSIYQILLSRAMKSCYIYCEDEKLRNYLRNEKKIKWCR